MNTMTKTNGQRNGVQKRIPIDNLVYGKIPPNALEIEEAILGAIMLETEAFDTVSELMKPECFYKDAHAEVYKAMQRLAQRSMPIEILTVTEELNKAGVDFPEGNAYFVTRLTNCVVSSANIETHAKICLDKYVLREMIRIGGEMISDAFEPMTDSFDLLDKMDKDLSLVTNNVHTKAYHRTDNLLVDAFKQIEHVRNQPEKLTGIPSGFRDIDKLTHGWQNQDLIILAARPSVGKTCLALNLAMNAALSPMGKTAVGFFSMEMSAQQCIQRLLSASSEVNLTNIQRGRLDNDQMRQLYANGVQRLSRADICIDDSPALNILQIRSKARKMKRKDNVGIIFIDYLQLMSGTKNKDRNRENEISEISRGLKSLAKELNIPIIALSQLSRETEKRSEKMPQLSDLRESGAIEQDADIVCFIYRPEYYDIHKTPTGETTSGETHLKFAKNRNGSLDTVKIKAQLWIQKFVPIDQMLLTNDAQKKSITGEVKVNDWLESEREKLRGQVEEPTDDLPF